MFKKLMALLVVFGVSVSAIGCSSGDKKADTKTPDKKEEKKEEKKS